MQLDPERLDVVRSVRAPREIRQIKLDLVPALGAVVGENDFYWSTQDDAKKFYWVTYTFLVSSIQYGVSGSHEPGTAVRRRAFGVDVALWASKW